ncbi:hypothetical protein EXIGLDRAFT_691920 [Exidia glandulosa HHB12029]|uniref:Uncharacterized protein n=1 Tax=Exidia glandulosa HHB12029 TaxID=1314781 RepID=A0A166MPC6_EXIGL|nr:hypothetical protein EXIGLDRAFT_691920 [Exidia glandulosa HHB12029]
MHPSSGKRPSCSLQLSRTPSQLPEHVHTAGVGVIDGVQNFMFFPGSGDNGSRLYSDHPGLSECVPYSFCSKVFTLDTPRASDRGWDGQTISRTSCTSLASAATTVWKTSFVPYCRAMPQRTSYAFWSHLGQPHGTPVNRTLIALRPVENSQERQICMSSKRRADSVAGLVPNWSDYLY